MDEKNKTSAIDPARNLYWIIENNIPYLTEFILNFYKILLVH